MFWQSMSKTITLAGSLGKNEVNIKGMKTVSRFLLLLLQQFWELLQTAIRSRKGFGGETGGWDWLRYVPMDPTRVWSCHSGHAGKESQQPRRWELCATCGILGFQDKLEVIWCKRMQDSWDCHWFGKSLHSPVGPLYIHRENAGSQRLRQDKPTFFFRSFDIFPGPRLVPLGNWETVPFFGGKSRVFEIFWGLDSGSVAEAGPLTFKVNSQISTFSPEPARRHQRGGFSRARSLLWDGSGHGPALERLHLLLASQVTGSEMVRGKMTAFDG